MKIESGLKQFSDSTAVLFDLALYSSVVTQEHVHGFVVVRRLQKPL